MNKPLNTLIVEDHQLIIDSYKMALDFVANRESDYSFKITISKSCEEAYLEIEHAANFGTVDLVFLDISLPPAKKYSILSGDDIGIKVRQLFPKAKILVITHLSDNYRLINILKCLKPNSLLLKNELDFNRLTESISNVLYGIPYYSHSVLKLVRQHISNDFNLDQIDRQVLYYLSQGNKTKDLPELVNLSLAGIERRKRKLNEIFNNDKKSDKVLIKIAKEKGFI
ncbi:response regulator transcription factor [Hyunsoonleella flava]|uniref:Response regulator transcription factor n=1 Tax=Hyunsoonleella flava TaxID=2527939 RepID=A0A4Q9FH05_9FLAO|nr:response regulator transcription factor [Hyunsoonleella flava]TBN04464.1 response regulator transcription factor [Hyunsoonleella flava]